MYGLDAISTHSPAAIVAKRYINAAPDEAHILLDRFRVKLKQNTNLDCISNSSNQEIDYTVLLRHKAFSSGFTNGRHCYLFFRIRLLRNCEERAREVAITTERKRCRARLLFWSWLATILYVEARVRKLLDAHTDPATDALRDVFVVRCG